MPHVQWPKAVSPQEQCYSNAWGWRNTYSTFHSHYLAVIQMVSFQLLGLLFPFWKIKVTLKPPEEWLFFFFTKNYNKEYICIHHNPVHSFICIYFVWNENFMRQCLAWLCMRHCCFSFSFTFSKSWWQLSLHWFTNGSITTCSLRNTELQRTVLSIQYCLVPKNLKILLKNQNSCENLSQNDFVLGFRIL